MSILLSLRAAAAATALPVRFGSTPDRTFVAFKMLKRTVKMAVRLTIVAVIIAIAAIGSIILWTFDGKPELPRPRPTSNR